MTRTKQTLSLALVLSFLAMPNLFAQERPWHKKKWEERRKEAQETVQDAEQIMKNWRRELREATPEQKARFLRNKETHAKELHSDGQSDKAKVTIRAAQMLLRHWKTNDNKFRAHWDGDEEPKEADAKETDEKKKEEEPDGDKILDRAEHDRKKEEENKEHDQKKEEVEAKKKELAEKRSQVKNAIEDLKEEATKAREEAQALRKEVAELKAEIEDLKKVQKEVEELKSLLHALALTDE